MFEDDICFSRAASIFIESNADYETIRKIIEKKSIKQILVKKKRQSRHIRQSINKLRLQKIDLFEVDAFGNFFHYYECPYKTRRLQHQYGFQKQS